MRALLASFTLITFFVARAQTNMDQMIQERMKQSQGQQGGGQTDAANVKVEDDNSPFVPNTFTGSFRMEMHMFKKGAEEKHSPMNLRYAFKEDMTSVKIEDPEQNNNGMRLLYDLKNKWQYMLVDDKKGKKTAIKQKMKKITMDTEKEKDKSDMKITVTDEYKEIEGHRCRKVTGESSDSKGEWWVAEDVPVDMMNVMNLQARGARHKEMAEFGSKGLPLEMTWEKKDGSEKILSNAKDLSIGTVDPVYFDLSGYEVTDMTAMPGFGGQ